MKNTLVLIAVALIVAGCFAPASKINAVSLGMSKAGVLKIMGQPVSITADQNAEHLNYTLLESMAWGTQPTPYEVKLVDGKVTSYGRAVTSREK